MKFWLISHLFIIEVLLIFFFALGIRGYWINQKEEINGDETFSVILSSYNDYGWTWGVDYSNKKIFTGKELKEITLWDNSSVRNAFGDIIKLRRDNRDNCHTNLYYSFLRLCFAGVKTGDIQRIILQGCLLNLVFFCCSFFMMYKLLDKLFERCQIIALGLIVAFFNTGSISNTLLLRPYQLQETLFILMAYIFVYVYLKIKENRWKNSWQNMWLMALPISFVLLTGYFAIIFVALIGIVLILESYFVNQKENIPFLVFIFFMSMILAGAFYCKYYDGFFSGRGQEALGKIKMSSFVNNLSCSALNYWKLLNNYLFYTFAVILLILSLFFVNFKKNELKDEFVVLLVLISFIWCFAILFFAPFKVLRYVAPIFPIISLLIPLVINRIRSLKKQFIFILAIGLCFVSLAFSVNRIENLNQDIVERQYFNHFTSVPVIISNSVPWKYSGLIPYFPDNQMCEFAKSNNELRTKVIKYQNVFIITERCDFIVPPNYKKTKKTECHGYFFVYQLSRIK